MTALGRTARILGIGIAATLAACTSSATPAPTPSAAIATAAPSASPSATPEASPSVAPSPSTSVASNEPSSSSGAVASPLPQVGNAPSGPWTAVDWIDAGNVLPKLQDVESGKSSDAFGLDLYSWSGGYIVFAADGGRNMGSSKPATLVATTSTDGLHWSDARPIDLPSGNQLQVVSMVEGPAGLLAVGEQVGDTCGGPPRVEGLWRSTDGSTWQPVTLPKDMTSATVHTVDAGDAGYIATGVKADGKTPRIWISPDAATWHDAALPKPPSGTLSIQGASSFAGGLVVDGAVIGPEGCGGASSIHPAVWWSNDGASWTREALPGAKSTPNEFISMFRLNEHELVATETVGDTNRAWVTQDGRTWTPAPTATGLTMFGVSSAAPRPITILEPDSGTGPSTYYMVDDQLGATPLKLTGSPPLNVPDTPSTEAAAGPTGIVVVATDGSHVWLGIPSGS